MSKIQFDIKFRPQIESGEYKVETRDGRAARVICWDRKDNNYPIIALFEEDSKECLFSYTQNGQHVIGKSNVSDLFLVTPEPELTPLEDLLSTYLKNDFEYFSTKKWDEKKWNEVMRIQAAELLSLARKQLQPEIDAEIEKAFQTADEMQYRKGREEALKDLPRWRKATGKERFDERMIVLTGDNDLFCTNYAEEGEYYLPFPILEKLPKEDSHE